MKKTKNGLYIGDTWETFLAQRDRVPNWKIPLSIAAVLHLVVFTGAAVFPDVGKKLVPDNVITLDLLSLPFELAPVAGRQVASRHEKQESSSQQPPPVEKVARNAAQEKVGKTTEPPAPEVEEIAEVAEAAEPTPVLPVVTPRKISKVARNAAQEKVGKTTEPPAPEVEEIAEVAEPTPVLPVVTPRKISKVVPKNVRKPVSPPPESVAQAKPVSLHPVKRKKKLADDIRLAEMKAREEQQAQQKLQQDREQLAASEKKRLAEQQKRKKAAKQKRKLAEQRKREKAVKQAGKLAEQRKREKAVKQARKLAARKKRQQEAAAKKRLADQKRRERGIAEAAHLARQAEQAAEQARLEAARARSEYASVAQAVSDLNTPLVAGDSGFSSGGYSEASGRESRGYGGYGREQRVNPAVLKQYAASLNSRISSHWQLPETVKTQSDLRTTVALTLRRDGSIEDMRIERKSGDSFFDQSVIKALQNAAPFAGFPALIKPSILEFVLNFTPLGLAP